MGTNYYAQIDCCKTCGKPGEELHIGKSSGGWRFLFRIYTDHEDGTDAPRSVEDWRALLDSSDVRIRNEYGESVSLEQFWDMVKRKQDLKSGGYADSDGEYRVLATYFF